LQICRATGLDVFGSRKTGVLGFPAHSSPNLAAYNNYERKNSTHTTTKVYGAKDKEVFLLSLSVPTRQTTTNSAFLITCWEDVYCHPEWIIGCSGV
jgi:hypothetical protein